MVVNNRRPWVCVKWKSVNTNTIESRRGYIRYMPRRNKVPKYYQTQALIAVNVHRQIGSHSPHSLIALMGAHCQERFRTPKMQRSNVQ